MYTIKTRIEGVSPLLQHKFAVLDTKPGAAKRTGALDYSNEWVASMYVDREGYLIQPASHIEGALVRAAASFRMKGAGRKTWKDPIRAYCYVVPDEIRHLHNDAPIPAPTEELLGNPTDNLSVHIGRVRVQRAAVARSRLMIATGWELAFTIEVHDPQVQSDIIQTILAEAGRAAGIGDFRPRYGRFQVTHFDVGPEQ